LWSVPGHDFIAGREVFIEKVFQAIDSLSEVAGSPDYAPDTLCLIFHNRMIFISLLMQDYRQNDPVNVLITKFICNRLANLAR
jgi:hypothetical protein